MSDDHFTVVAEELGQMRRVTVTFAPVVVVEEADDTEPTLPY